jgi:hypothetical protein
MSTKIGHGYLITLNGLNEIHNMLMEFRRRVEEKMIELLHRTMAEDIAAIIDTVTIRENYMDVLKSDYEVRSHPKPDDSALLIAYLHAQKQNELVINHHSDADPRYNFHCNVTIIPTESKVFALLHSENEEYNQIWESMNGVQAYPYYNHSERPEDVTEEEWEQRKEDWDLAFSESVIPSLSGLVFRCILYLPQVDLEKIIPYLPSLDERVSQHAYDQTLSGQMANIKNNSEDELMGPFYAAKKWLGTEEGKSSYNLNKELLLCVLRARIDLEDMRKPIQSFEHLGCTPTLC